MPWPPASGTYPSWPPIEFHSNWVSFSDRDTAEKALTSLGFTWRNPTTQENNTYFKNLRDEDNHVMNGIMVVSPDGLRAYPFCFCVDPKHRELFVLWPPYDAGAMSNNK